MPRISKKARSYGRRLTTNFKKAVVADTVKAMARKSETKLRTSLHREATMSTLTQSFREHTPCRISTGTLVNDRVGNEVNYTGFDIRGYFNNNSADKVIMVRAMAIIDKERNGNTTSLDALLIKDNIPSAHTQGAMSMVLRPNTRRYRVLWDRTFKLGPHNQTDQGASVRTFKKFIKTQLKCNYNDGNAGSICSNDVKVVFWSSEAQDDVLLGDNVELFSQVVGYYKDM